MNPQKSSYMRVAAYVALHARRRPGHVAVVANDRPVTYAKLHQDLQAVTQALRGFGLAPGSQVAVGHEDLYIQLLLVFGLESLGIACGSFRPSEGPECHLLVAAADLTLVQNPAPHRPYRRLFEITDAWFQAALAAPVIAPAHVAPAHVAPAAPDEVAVVFRSSGTTGLPKRMLVTHRMVNTRLANQRRSPGLGLNAKSRFLAIMHFAVGGMYLAASNCLRLGATFMFNMQSGALAALLPYQPTGMTIMPYNLGELLTLLPRRAESAGPVLPRLTVISIGAPLPVELRQAALQRLCGRIWELYGSNESGTAAVIDENGVGTCTTVLEAAVVDDDGNPVPVGQTGQLRLRGNTVVQGYLDDAAATAEKFRGGWFYPGDLAALVAPGRIKLVGRPGDVLNLGGVKIAAAVLESKIMARAPLRDIALLQPDGAGVCPPVVACVVVSGGADMQALAKIIGQIIGFPSTLGVVTEIPRTAEGKIKRETLRRHLSGDAPAPQTLLVPQGNEQHDEMRRQPA
jgi:acyl-CoA synthetase (AMP-forming)/AMP-acid ligase II